MISKLPGAEVAAEAAAVEGGVGGTMVVRQIVERATLFIHAPQIMDNIPRVLTEMNGMGATTGTAGVEAETAITNNQRIHRDPLILLLSNNSMVDTVDTAVADLLEEGRHRIMVAMYLDVVVLHPEAELPVMARRMDKVDMVDMEQVITMDMVVVMVTMVDMVVTMGIKAEEEEVRHTMSHLVEEAGLGSYILHT